MKWINATTEPPPGRSRDILAAYRGGNNIIMWVFLLVQYIGDQWIDEDGEDNGTPEFWMEIEEPSQPRSE